jgi:hypothetical protein
MNTAIFVCVCVCVCRIHMSTAPFASELKSHVHCNAHTNSLSLSLSLSLIGAHSTEDYQVIKDHAPFLDRFLSTLSRIKKVVGEM